MSDPQWMGVRITTEVSSKDRFPQNYFSEIKGSIIKNVIKTWTFFLFTLTTVDVEQYHSKKFRTFMRFLKQFYLSGLNTG